MSIYTKITTFISLMLINTYVFANGHPDLGGSGGTTTHNIPEPSSLAILSIGVVALIATRFMKK